MVFEKFTKSCRKNISSWVLGLKIAMAYKFEFLIGLFTTPITLFIFYFLWKSIYTYSSVTIIRGYTFDMLVDYFVLSMLVGYFAWSDIDHWMEHMIVHGDMIADLVRPMRFIKAEFYFELGLKTMALVTQAIPLVFGSYLLLGLSFFSWKLTILATISTALASTMFFLISYIIGMGAFWLNRISGIRRMKRGIILFMSGGLLPIAFFPEWFISLSNYLPFQYIRYVPINIYTGKYSVAGFGFENIFVVFGVQVLWVLALLLIASKMWRKALKKFSGAGA